MPLAGAETQLQWSDHDISLLMKLTSLELPMRDIARKLDRPVELVRAKAQQVAIANMLSCPDRPSFPPPAARGH